MAMAEKLSVQQLQQAVQSGSLPAYIGIPLIEQKTKEKAQMAAAQGGQQQPPSVVSQILQQAEQEDQGIAQLPSNLPMMDDEEMGMAGGGIVAFAGEDGSYVDYSKMPTADLTEAEFNALPSKEQERRIREAKSLSSNLVGFKRFGLDLLPAVPATLGAVATTPFLAGARAVLPESVNERLPTVGDLFGERGVGGIVQRAGDKGIAADLNTREAKLREGLRTYDPVAEGASPAAQEPDFVGGQTGGGAYVGYRKQKGAGSGTPKGREPVLPQQELSALDFDAPVTTLPPVIVNAGREPIMDSDYEPPVSRAGGAGQGTPGAKGRGAPTTQDAGGAPTARQTAPAAQAPAAQPEGQSALDKYAAMLMAEREGSGKERDKAKAMAIFQAGLGIMGGTSPNALANIAQGALPATQAYQQEIKGIRREDAARLKELMGLGVSKEKLALEAKKLGISEKRFDQMYELEKQKIGIMGGSRADAAQNSEALRRDQLAKGYFELFLKQNPMATEAEMDVFRDRARAFAARDAGGAVPTSTNKYAGFSIVK